MVTYASPQAGYDDVAIGDVNGDGLNDVVKMNGQGYANSNLSVYLQSASGTLASAASYSVGCTCLGRGVAVGDVTGDGRSDIVMTYGGNSPGSHVAVFAQENDGSLRPAVSYNACDMPEAIKLADFNGDARLDMIVANVVDHTLSIFINRSPAP